MAAEMCRLTTTINTSYTSGPTLCDVNGSETWGTSLVANTTTDRITVQVDGVYEMHLSFSFLGLAASITGRMYVYLNGSPMNAPTPFELPNYGTENSFAQGLAGAIQTVSIKRIAELSTNDYLQVYGYTQGITITALDIMLQVKKIGE